MFSFDERQLAGGRDSAAAAGVFVANPWHDSGVVLSR